MPTIRKTDLTPEAKRLRSEYARSWRARNPEKVQQTLARYWNRKAEQQQNRGKATTKKGDQVNE